MKARILKSFEGQAVDSYTHPIRTWEHRNLLATKIHKDLNRGYEFIIYYNGKEIDLKKPMPVEYIAGELAKL